MGAQESPRLDAARVQVTFMALTSVMVSETVSLEAGTALLVPLRAAGLRMSRKVRALELMVANATPTQSVLDAYRAS